MAEIDQNVLELVERRIAERVGDNVERTLKWRYGLLLGGFIAIASFFGLSIKSGIDAEIAGVVKDSRDEVDAEIEKLVGKAQESSRQAEISFGIATDVGRRVMSNMDLVDKRVGDFDVKLKIMETIEGRVDGLGRKLEDLGAQSDARLAKLAINLDEVGRIRAIDDNLASLAQQVATLQSVVRDIAAAAKPESLPSPAYGVAKSAVESIVEQSNQRSEAFSKASDQPLTVFFQFAGGRREQAADLSNLLRAAGYSVPGEERTGGAARQHEIRYFYESDLAGANALAETVDAAMQRLGYEIAPVTIVDLTGYRKLKPREGTLELWLEIPPRQAAG
ncbi:MAG TPA: hypothetical protein PKA13_23080 [Geminicoccaceae bacterium]|nr:hypothetical protein [Geminicoccus sp.]HMU52679.1 hypothetical protein [Geminicoccaceae bacterium]